MSHKNQKSVRPVASSLQELGSLIQTGLDVTAGVDVVVPELLLEQYEELKAINAEVDRIVSAAEHITKKFQADRKSALITWDSLQSDRSRILGKRESIALNAYAEAVKTQKFQHAYDLYVWAGRDTKPLQSALLAHFQAQAANLFVEELTKVEKDLEGLLPAHEEAAKYDDSFVPAEALKMLDLAASMKKDAKAIEETLKASLDMEPGTTW